jgi:hypothetical protein
MAIFAGYVEAYSAPVRTDWSKAEAGFRSLMPYPLNAKSAPRGFARALKSCFGDVATAAQPLRTRQAKPRTTPLISRQTPATMDAVKISRIMATHSSAERNRRTPPEFLMVRLSDWGTRKETFTLS